MSTQTNVLQSMRLRMQYAFPQSNLDSTSQNPEHASPVETPRNRIKIKIDINQIFAKQSLTSHPFILCALLDVEQKKNIQYNDM